jgi:quercetin dioxygenase-like cupin family protein
MNKDHSCSTQYHKYKRETIVVFSGEINVYISGEFMRKLVPGDCITILPYVVHKIEALSDCVFLETSTNELWDVIRLQDNYNRTTEVVRPEEFNLSVEIPTQYII